MKTPMKLMVALLFLVAPLFAFGASPDVMVVFSGRTEVNMRAYNWIREYFQANNVPHSLAATLDPLSVRPGQYRLVVVINTGTASGLDPVLKKFIDGFGDKKSLYLVNLFRNKADLTVTTFTAAGSPDGVDGGLGGVDVAKPLDGGKNVQEMHLAWAGDLVRFLGRS